MAKHIIIYDILQCYEDGGGIQIEYPDTEQDMHQRVADLHQQHQEKIKIVDAGFLQTEFTYEPVKYAIKLDPVKK